MTHHLDSLYLTRSYSHARFHVFSKKDNRSLCGKAMMLSVDKNNIESLNGKEIYSKGQDCKGCFRRAGLKVGLG